MTPRRTLSPRLIALSGAVAVAVLLPLAGAFAGPVGDAAPTDAKPLGAKPADAGTTDAGTDDTGTDDIGSDDAGADDAQAEDGDGGRSGGAGPGASPAPARNSALLSGLGLTAAAQCGPELSSPDGVEAQTCVLTQGNDRWARTYYRNATGQSLSAVLTAMGPGGRTVQVHCAVGADDEPGTCETPRERAVGAASGHTAVAEFAAAEDGALLLRSGSNSGSPGAG